MKIFFIGTPRGDLVNGKLIYETLEKLGHKHTTDFMARINPTSFYVEDEKTWQKRYASRLGEIARADVCVFEVSMHSLAIGQLTQEAIRNEKPTILLYLQGKKPYFFRGAAEAESRVQLLEYTTDTLQDVLSYALEIAQELLTTRFTMLMPKELNTFLDKIHKQTGLSRSEYIRKLIMEKMKGEK